MASADLSPDVQSLLCDPHPLLKGGRPAHAHSWSSDQIRVLGAICDTFVPSLPVEALNATLRVRTKADDAYCSDEDVDALYRTSASDLKIPEEVAGMIFKWLKPHLVFSLGIILWLLSTKFGTLMLCGSLSFAEHFPYIQTFPKLSNRKKEQVLLGWVRSSISAFQSLYKILKCFCLWNFYTKADETGGNQVWNAIGFRNASMQLSQCKSIPQDSVCRSSSESVLKSRLFDACAGVKALHEFLTHIGCLPLEDLSCLDASCENQEKFVLEEDIGIKSDVVVVGSGSGGAVIARALAQKGYSVVVVEKGKYFPEKDLSLLEGPTMQSMYEGGGVLGTDDGGVNILAGSTLGGGSAVNWSGSISTPGHVLREWAEGHGLSLFASEDYQKAMQEVCKRLGVQATVRKESFQNAVFRKGCKELGYPVSSIPQNAGPDHACGFFCGLGCKRGEKQATTKTWLVDAATADAVILTGCRAEKVLFKSLKDKGKKPFRIEGIQASLSDGGRLFIQAKSVVIACGSLMTPILLQKSGLQNQNIGKFLHIHPTHMVWGYFPEESGPKGVCYEGPIMTAVSGVAANWESSGYGALLEVPALLPGGFASLMPWCSGADSKRTMSRYSRTAHCFVLARDKGSGVIKLDKRGHLSILYKLSPEDEESLKQGADRALRVLIAAGAQEVGTHHPDGEKLQVKGAEMSEIEDYLCRVRSKSLTQASTSLCSAHQMGSCRMGIDPSSSVVDPKGESWKVEGLFIGDTSVFPTASGVNPMVTVQSIAFCTAKSVNEYLKRISS